MWIIRNARGTDEFIVVCVTNTVIPYNLRNNVFSKGIVRTSYMYACTYLLKMNYTFQYRKKRIWILHYGIQQNYVDRLIFHGEK